MANTPWMNSTDLLDSIKRKVMFPTSQDTFSDSDLLKFVSEELLVAQVPSILKYKEEYFVTSKTVPLVANVSNYEIPDRAIGMKLRDVFWQDQSGNLFEMTQIGSDDRAYFQRNVGANSSIEKFYLQGNFIVVTPSVTDSPTGSLLMLYYLRPNQLVTIDRAATVTAFSKSITVVNASVLSGDTITIGDVVLTAGTDFSIGGSSTITATNIVNAIATNGTYSASNGSPASATVVISFSDVTTDVSVSNSTGFSLQSTLGVVTDAVPTVFTVGADVDFLQTKSGHRTKGMDVSISSISSNTLNFTSSNVPIDLIVGDYICLSNECIIPQIPTDLHSGLAERAALRILAALGDQAGMQASASKIQEMEATQGPMLDSRVEGAVRKVLNRHSPLRYGKGRGGFSR